MASPLRFIVLGLILAMFCYGVFDILKNIEPNGCEMTYMFEPPQYLVVIHCLSYLPIATVT